MTDLSTVFRRLSSQPIKHSDLNLIQTTPRVETLTERVKDESEALEEIKQRLEIMEQYTPAYIPANGVPPAVHALVKAYCEAIAGQIRKRDSRGKLIPFFREYQLADLSTIVVTPVRTLKITPYSITVLNDKHHTPPRLVPKVVSSEYPWDSEIATQCEEHPCLENDLLFDCDEIEHYTFNQINNQIRLLHGQLLDAHIESMITARLFNTLWGMPTSRLAKYIMKRISKLLDPAAKALTRLVFGYKFKMRDYNIVCKHFARIKKLTDEAHNLAPFIRLYLMAPSQHNVTLRRFQEIMPPAAIENDSFFKVVKDTLIRDFDFTPGMWNWIAKQNYRAVASTVYYAKSDLTLLRRWIGFCTKSEVNLPETIRKYLLKRARGWFDRLPPRVAQSIEEGAAIAKKQRRLKHFAEDDLQLVLDCLKGPLRDDLDVVASGIPRPLPKSQVNSWRKLWNMQLKWHQQRLNQKHVGKAIAWECALEQFEFNGHLVIPLTTSTALYQEGISQHHCVYAYTGQCVRGESRIFSIRQEDMTVATVELGFDDVGEPFVAQCRGSWNKHVSSEIVSIAEEISRRYALVG